MLLVAWFRSQNRIVGHSCDSRWMTYTLWNSENIKLRNIEIIESCSPLHILATCILWIFLVFLKTSSLRSPGENPSLRSSSTFTSPQDVQQAKIMTPATPVSCPRIWLEENFPFTKVCYMHKRLSINRLDSVPLEFKNAMEAPTLKRHRISFDCVTS